MPDSRFLDVLQSHLFWAMDISGGTNFPVFTPFFGFSGISSPKINVDVETFRDGTYNYPRHVVKGASVAPITFARAASMYDSDFYDWIYYAVNGTTAAKATNTSIGDFVGSHSGPVRRDILIIHFARINLGGDNGTRQGALGALLGAVAGGLSGAVAGGLLGTAAGGLIGFTAGPLQFASWLPARAWILHGAIPIDYSAGSDFDANSAAVSLATLSVQPEVIEEFNLGI